MYDCHRLALGKEARIFYPKSCAYFAYRCVKREFLTYELKPFNTSLFNFTHSGL